jgi:hypothetical protein
MSMYSVSMCVSVEADSEQEAKTITEKAMENKDHFIFTGAMESMEAELEEE